MCRMIGCLSTSASELEYPLLGAPHALIRQSREDRAGKCHRDGWGIASFAGDGLLIVQKNHEPAFEDKLFAEYAAHLRAPVWLAHVRAASTGNVRRENTHPFHYRNWAWVHNGTIIKPLDLLNDMIMAKIVPEFRALRIGATDSELCFLLFLSELHRRSNTGFDNPPSAMVTSAMREVINFLNTVATPLKKNPPTMNFMASNGKILVATRWGKPLWTLQGHRVGGSETRNEFPIAYIASEPFDENDWKEVPDHSLVIVDSLASVVITSLEN